MARTTAELVATVIDVEAGDSLTAYIDTANALVTELCTDSGYSDVRLELIERWLSSHFYDINRPRTQSEAVTGSSGVQESFERVKVDLGLHNTKYGQTAMFLDTAGNLAALTNTLNVVKKAVAAAGASETKWLGTVAT